MAGGDDLALPYEDLWYIKLSERDSKFPLEKWGGYDQDFDAVDTVYSHAEVLESDWQWWGIVGIKDNPHMPRCFLAFDFDVHKASDDFDPDDVTVPKSWPLVRSQSGGLHGYTILQGQRGTAKESEFRMTADLEWDIDIRGSAVKHHVVAPADIPGVGGSYELVRDNWIPGVTDPGEAADGILYQDEPLLEYERDGGLGFRTTDVEIDPDKEPPADMPNCYAAALSLRASPSIDEHPNAHKVNVLAALCGLHAGYPIEEMVTHLVEDFPPGGRPALADPEETAYQLRHIRDGGYSPPSVETLRDYGVLSDDEGCSCDVHGAGAVEATASQQYAVETCQPPLDDPRPFDARDRWQHLQGERYDAVVDADAPVIWKDPAGAGKTTNAILAALERDRPVAALFDKHEKAREVVTDDALPDEWDPFHLKGGAQKRHAPCMDADHAGETCPEHGASDACPSMCPVYDLPEDSDVRQRYEAVAREVGDVRAHLILGDDLPGHDEDGDGPWRQQFDALETADHVVGVHEYQVLKTVRDGRDVIVDEAPRSLRDERRVTVEGLIRTANALEDLADAEPRDDPVTHTARDAARFVRDLADAVGGGETPLADLEPPAPTWRAWEAKNSAAGNYVETEPPDEDWQVGEALAQFKLAFNRLLVNRIRGDRWNGTPFCMDAILATAADAGLPTDAVMQAVAIPPLLDHCPWCGSDLAHHDGAMACGADDCDWHEREHTVLLTDSEQARARASLATDAEDSVVALRHEALPLVSDLPSDPLVLDATATPSKVAHLYGADRDEVTVAGDDDLAANMRVTQVLDGQYHPGTIRDAMTDADGEILPRDEWGTLADRNQRSIDTTAQLYDRPLYLVKKDLKPLFDFPDHGEVHHYHAMRGLNRDECDAVICIGAPHPRIDDLQREAELLAMGRDDVRVGGTEYSTRRDAPNPPVYRKLRYTDDHGQGRAVPTKHYSGLVGDLFRETRKNELEQAPHRARPILLDDDDDPIDVYLLTNVPTDLPIDEVCSFSELADPLRAMLPAPDGALELLDTVANVAAGNEKAPDGFRADALVDARDGTIEEKVATYHRLAHLSGRDQLQVTERTIRNWITALEDLGLLAATAYEQREGRRYTAELATLKSTLSTLSGNAGFKVAAVRRFRALAEAADGSLEWLRWAREAFGLPAGASIGGDPPPDDPV